MAITETCGRLVRKFGGARNKGAVKRAIMAIAHTLLKIACQVLKTGTPCTDLGAGFYASRETPRIFHGALLTAE